MSVTHRRANKEFQKWMRELHRIASEEFGIPPGSAAGDATKPGCVEEGDWITFYNDGMTPREALIDDFRNS